MQVSKGLGTVGVEEEIDTGRVDQGREHNRDYSTAVKALFRKIGITEQTNTRDGSSALTQGDVTQHAVDRSVAKAYESANLATFEQFKDEQWTQERFRVAMLERARAEVPGLLFGNNFRRVEMDTIDEMIRRSGRAIYKRALETSELIAVNQATARFTRALYELYGPLEHENLRAGVEEMLLGANRLAFADYEERFVRSEYGVILRYRAERILNDCLTSNIEEIVAKKDEPLTKELMIDRVEELARGECRNWVVNALGDPKATDGKEDEKVLKPLPVRAVWMAPGMPKTDVSMFVRASGNDALIARSKNARFRQPCCAVRSFGLRSRKSLDPDRRRGPPAGCCAAPPTEKRAQSGVPPALPRQSQLEIRRFAATRSPRWA